MNIITICHKDDLQEIIDYPICLSGITDNEIEHNMWCITIDENCLQGLTKKYVWLNFFDALLIEKTRQVCSVNPQAQATLYIWFDKQALQLRFNILSGVIIDLPFQCQLQKVSKLDIIIDDFLQTVNHIAQHGDPIEIINMDDPDFDDDEEDFILNVYAVSLNEK